MQCNTRKETKLAVEVQLGHCWGTVRTQLGTVGSQGTVEGRGTVGAQSQLGLKLIQVY